MLRIGETMKLVRLWQQMLFQLVVQVVCFEGWFVSRPSKMWLQPAVMMHCH